jgi:N,N'-diacetyllegionaminate synthase
MARTFSAEHCTVVGEVALAHDGSLGAAHAYIDAIAHAGADCVKFQTHLAEAESTAAEPWRVRFSPQDQTRYDYWKRTGFTEQQWTGLKAHAAELGLLFVSSPFSLEAAKLLARVGVDAWKTASGELTNTELLQYFASTHLPILLSTGMSSWSEIDRAVAWVQSEGLELTVLQCTSQYPCPPEKVGVKLLPVFQNRYRCPVGLSDHSGTIYPSLLAVGFGAKVVEVHVVLSRECYGPDVPASITTEELRELVDGVHFIERMMNASVDKDEMAAELQPVRRIFQKSIVASMDLPAGTVLETWHLAFKKPGTGIPPDRLHEVLGHALQHAVRTDQMLAESDVGILSH